MRTSRKIVLLVCGLGLASRLGSGAWADFTGEREIEDHLRRFALEPKKVMSEAPQKWDERGNRIPLNRESRFSAEAIANGTAHATRDAQRSQMIMGVGPLDSLRPQAAIGGNDRPEDLLDSSSIVRTLEGLEAQGLRKAQLAERPWSDDFWGIYKGILGARYADPDFPANQPGEDAKDWGANRAYIRARSVRAILRSGDPERIDRLSPSEKYERLIGGEGTLTEILWNRGRMEYELSGRVEDWQGICHGWAPAALVLQRPKKMIRLPSADGTGAVNFYPSDLKALASLLWARAPGAARYLGGRCNVKKPETDANGRVISDKCFDTNPGAWHLAVTHQLGVAHRSLILDSTYDYEIWNQPVYSYKYGYFNPQTLGPASTIGEARVLMRQFTTDKFRAYRSPQTKSVVGIVMDLTYVAVTGPSHAATDSPAQDALRVVRYFYDLELNAAQEIIGGEWYTNAHPDFIWVPEPGGQARSVAEDAATGSWDGVGALPRSWRRAAATAAESGQPLGKIVEKLLAIAHVD